jgi:CHASE3 domain sensor protein
MKSRIIRVFLTAVAIAIGAASAYFLRTTELTIGGDRAAANSLRDERDGLLAALADVRTAQVSYVARGQGEAFWMSHVSKLLPALEQQMNEFKATLSSPAAQADFEPAAASIENFHKLDARAQEYVKSGDPLLASDLIFSDGIGTIATATAQVQTAFTDELKARDQSAAGLRMRELAILGGGAAGVLMILLMLGFSGGSSIPEVERFAEPLPLPEPLTVTKIVGVKPDALATAADVCTAMARATESRQLPALLERSAKIMGASGIIVWVADPSGRELRPVMAFGYSDQVLARMGSIAREATNAAAAAYRAGKVRTVSGDGPANGALVAPLMTADGCIGVLSAEMKGGSEKDEGSQALASIFAAQLATLVSPPAAAPLSRAAAEA